MSKRNTTTHALVIKTLAIPETEIRTTPDKRVSVYDAIKAVTGAGNPRQVWNDLLKTYPEAVQKTDSYKFPGRGQLPTPVTNKQGLVYIFGLLPGTVGHTIREDAANLIVRYIEGDPTLAEEVIDRQNDPETLHRLALRAKSIGVRKSFTDTLKLHGATVNGSINTYAQVTGLLTRSITGSKAQQIQQYTGIKRTRDALPSVYLSLTITGEELTTANIRKRQASGHQQLCQATMEVAQDLEQLRQKYAIPDWPEKN